ncbi:MAG: metallophosphoesterase [Chitinophagaceae bacterium]|nr:MAG: metallophosphoesterase [Chitinophagaceae bacterium]
MRSPLGFIIFTGFMLALDFYFYQAVKTVSQGLSPKAKLIIAIVYWGFTLLALGGFMLFVFTEPQVLGKKIRTYLFATVIGLFLAKLTAMIFFLTDDIRRGIQWVAGKLLFNNTEVEKMSGEGISRSVFLSWLGIAAGGTLFSSLVYGFGNKYNYDVKRLQLTYENLPSAFKGMKVVHISDIHSGSLLDRNAVAAGVQKILAEQPDIIFFTGDLVNDQATEMDHLKHVFAQLKAPMGVYSTLGNHDYGDYVQWPIDGISKEQNLENIKNVHADMGWKLLMNEHVVLEKDAQQIAVIGVENWSARGRFPKHGKMQEAHAGARDIPFKILLSHDPSHWEAEVKPLYSDVDLMLSGHTHGMQFGVEIPGFRWSPVQYMYRQWAGLYEDAGQKLYVNRGFGFIGYPGRVGVLPEITVLEFV